jgi:MtN3 and saliva related transmembrane protein
MAQDGPPGRVLPGQVTSPDLTQATRGQHFGTLYGRGDHGRKRPRAWLQEPCVSDLGAAAASWGIVMAISPGVQIRKILRHRSSRDVSITYFWVLLVGFALWIAYAVVIDNWFLIVPNLVALMVSAATIIVAVKYRVE